MRGHFIFRWCFKNMTRCVAVATDTLRGHGPIDAAYVNQWVNFADNEVLPAACTWVFPCMGIMQYNKQVR